VAGYPWSFLGTVGNVLLFPKINDYERREEKKEEERRRRREGEENLCLKEGRLSVTFLK